MARLSNFRRIYAPDYDAQYKALIERLGTSINIAFDEIYDALNNKLTFRDNIKSTIVSVDVTVNSSGEPIRLTQFRLASGQDTLEGIWTIDAYGTRNAAILPTGGVFVSFSKNEDFVTIQNVKGLQPNIQYTIKLLAIG